MNVTCQELITFLADYIAEELPPARRTEFDRHLARCPSCVAYLHSYRETIRLARTSVEDIPPEVLTAILATITTTRK